MATGTKSRKTLERIQAWRLSYYAAKFNLFPSNQYGGINGHSAQDTVVSIVHDIEAVWNHNRTTTLLTFDIMGYFNFIPHSFLIDTLRQIGRASCRERVSPYV